MRYWRILLTLSAVAALACTHAVSRGNQRAALQPNTYTLEINFEGLVGYFNDADGVWALLPKAHTTLLPPGVDSNDIDLYPEHYAVLKINGANIKNFNIPGKIHIPIEDYEIDLPFVFTATGSGIPVAPFAQLSGEPADKLNLSVINGPNPPMELSARIKLPFLSSPTDWIIDTRGSNGSIPYFLRAVPMPKNANGFCKDTIATGTATVPRVEAVTWKKAGLTGDLLLKLHSLRTQDPDLPLTLTPLPGQTTISIWILNKEGASLYDDSYDDEHFAPYRWFYGLSDPAARNNCDNHYYPQMGAGGNRCPEKLYTN